MNEDTVKIHGDDVKHIAKVMRMDIDDEIICCSPSGRSVRSKLISIDQHEVIAKPVEWLDERKQLPLQVTIVQGMPKGDKLELVIQKGTELGAERFVPFKAERSVVKWDKQKSEKSFSD